MRDTWLLRSRLHTALACLPLATGLGCGSGPGAAPGPAGAAARAETQPAAERPGPVSAAPAPAEPTTTPTTTPTSAPTPSPYPERWGIDPYDPDGMEEEGCPNGDWCGPAKLAEKLKTQNATEELGCPTRLMGAAKDKLKLDERQYKGLSMNPMMQGRLRKIATAERRQATGDDELCCYHWFDYCSGRPLLDDALAGVRAPLQPGDSWLSGHVSEDSATAQAIAGLPLATRRALALQWLDDARSEHASVAAFARATLELMAVGAPPELVFASQQASLDEIRHAQTCFGLAALYAGEAAEPGPLPAVAPRPGGLVALACATFVEGCVGETIAALAALRAARGCPLAPVHTALLGIAEDETRHAELAWATLAFAVHSGGAEVATALRELADELRAASLGDEPGAQTTSETTTELPADLLAAHGRLSAAALAEARRDAWLEIVGPTLELVLAAHPAVAHDHDPLLS